MRNFYATFLFISVLFFLKSSAQVIPDSLRVDWSQAGYPGYIPDPALVINVKDFGAYGDSVHDDYKAVVNAMNSSAVFRTVFFPAGNYLIKSSLVLPNNVVLRGEGINSNLVFDLSASSHKNAIDISAAQSNAFTGIDSGYNKGSTLLKLSAPAGLTRGSIAELREANGAWNTVPASWATFCVGQMVTIKAVNGNYITIDPALRIDYAAGLQPQIRPVTLKTNVGIECLKITRTDTIINGRYGHNIIFNYAGNCWVTGIESAKSQAAHILLQSGKNISISGSYFHDAFTYDGTATAGYGITMIQHNSDCKVENCIFKHLRHAMVAKQGANGNVFAYNYSLDPYRSEYPHDAGGDMLLHGHYPFANLFEGNIGQSIIVDDTWGPAGPYNTFFRNRADLYGIVIFDQTVSIRNQNIVGNEVTDSDSQKGNYNLQPNYHFTYDNNIRGVIMPTGTGTLNDVSYYLTAKPYFWNISFNWPSVGGSNILGSGTNPAKERYLAGSQTTCIKQQLSNLHINMSADSIKCNGSLSHILVNAAGGTPPYAGTGEFYKPAGSYTFVVTDASGQSDSVKLNITQPAIITAAANTTAAQTCKVIGSITIVNTTGGHAPYTFSLNGTNYVTNATFKNLAAGSYKAYIKDNSGCGDTIRNIVVASVPTIQVSAATTKASSCNNDGTITVKESGGTAPFLYSLNKIDFISNNVFSGIAPGIYTAWVKDETGCIDSVNNITVRRVAALKATVQKTNVSCKNASDGKIIVNASGGTTPYLYSLDSVNYSSNNTFTNLSAGKYKAWVKDASACTAFITTTISNSTTVCSSLKVFATTGFKVSVVPNPSSQNFMLTITRASKEDIQLYIYDMYGIRIYAVNNVTEKNYLFGENFIPGVYVLQIIQGSVSKTYKLIKQ
jgi:hypothetical protein